MGKIYVVMGKSASGKDSIYNILLNDKELGLKKCVIYTTRPMREGETQGEEYHFVNDKMYENMLLQGKVIEHRTYQTVYGPWHYFTVDDGQFDGNEDVIVIGTLESYAHIKEYFGKEKVAPIYVEVDDYTRLSRALERERYQKTPGYVEVCRRFVADSEDFSEEKISEAGIVKRFSNNEIEACVDEIRGYIRGEIMPDD